MSVCVSVSGQMHMQVISSRWEGVYRVSLQSGIFIGMNRLYYTLKEVFLIHCSIVSATLNNSYVVFKSGSGTQLKTVIVVYVQL